METQSKKRTLIAGPFAHSSETESEADLPLIVMEFSAENQAPGAAHGVALVEPEGGTFLAVVHHGVEHESKVECPAYAAGAECRAIAMEAAAEKTLEQEIVGTAQIHKEWAAVRLAMALIAEPELARARWQSFKKNEEYNSVLLAAEAMATRWIRDSKTLQTDRI